MLWDHRWWGRRTTCSGTGQEMGWARETSFARMPSSALGKVCTTCVLCSDNLLLPCPWSHLVTADMGVMQRPCFKEDVLLLSDVASLLACVCVCRGGEVFGSIYIASPALLWPSTFSSLSCVTQPSCSVLCAIRIAQQWSVRGKQLRKGFAWFWEVAEACVCLVGKGVRF